MKDNRQEMPAVGFRFRPTEEELVFHYLQKKVQGEPLTPNVIPNCDIYNKEPWQLEIVKSNPKEDCFYVFTELKRRGAKARIERVAGCGTWKNQHKKEIKDGNGEVIGYKRSFSFEAKDAMATNDQWTMLEFSLVRKDLPFINDFALCEIRRNTSSGSKSKAKRNRNDYEGINEDTVQPQVENEDTSFQNNCGLSNPKLCGEGSQHPKKTQLIPSLPEEAPTENQIAPNDYIEDHQYQLELFWSSCDVPDLPQLENQDISNQEMFAGEFWDTLDELPSQLVNHGSSNHVMQIDEHY